MRDAGGGVAGKEATWERTVHAGVLHAALRATQAATAPVAEGDADEAAAAAVAAAAEADDEETNTAGWKRAYARHLDEVAIAESCFTGVARRAARGS